MVNFETDIDNNILLNSSIIMNSRIPYKARIGGNKQSNSTTIRCNTIHRNMRKRHCTQIVCLVFATIVSIVNASHVRRSFMEDANSNMIPNSRNNENNKVRNMLNTNILLSTNDVLTKSSNIPKIDIVSNTASSCAKINKSCSIQPKQSYKLALCHFLPNGKNFGDELGKFCGAFRILVFFIGVGDNHSQSFPLNFLGIFTIIVSFA
jgi:hypothetical protein